MLYILEVDYMGSYSRTVVCLMTAAALIFLLVALALRDDGPAYGAGPSESLWRRKVWIPLKRIMPQEQVSAPPCMWDTDIHGGLKGENRGNKNCRYNMGISQKQKT